MLSFGKRIAILRKEIGLSQTDLANQLNTSVSVVSRYELDKMTPSVDTAKKLAELLNTSVGYLLGETDNAELFKNPEMLRRFQDIDQFNDEDKKYILYTLDALIKNVKLKSI
ncbi:XRE family transcriptional regulator [Flavobacterium columnare]|uniref:XRE family transcriptional regulator n=1 Tax=Flavobacterium columnare TaxID=996 RepID=A0A437UB55_9FLAO|nr:helix-turn-helix transcriptional regulator [Flavobacterium columnare]MBP7859870.1 helix-turn-helix transcriptional regulator [Patescibacteria group bacterium]RVU90848.1 XRE family transcriptional regulator [Flavobacterium columnare]RVU90862.1 XRE family transcriptional regulator [Flavobacterium columnare]RVU90869.1 XRE family transcriptional regulator [Flavobacterium columnare]